MRLSSAQCDRCLGRPAHHQQVAAAHLGKETQFASLEIACEAASAARAYRIAATVVGQVRLAIEKLHRECMAFWGEYAEEHRRLLAQVEERARGRVDWQAMAKPPWDSSFWSSVERAQGLVNWHTLAATEYEIPPEDIMASPPATAKKRRKWWRFWESA